MNWLSWKLGFTVRWRLSRGSACWTIYLGRLVGPETIRQCVEQVERFEADGWAVVEKPPASFCSPDQGWLRWRLDLCGHVFRTPCYSGRMAYCRTFGDAFHSPSRSGDAVVAVPRC